MRVLLIGDDLSVAFVFNFVGSPKRDHNLSSREFSTSLISSLALQIQPPNERGLLAT